MSLIDDPKSDTEICEMLGINKETDKLTPGYSGNPMSQFKKGCSATPNSTSHNVSFSLHRQLCSAASLCNRRVTHPKFELSLQPTPLRWLHFLDQHSQRARGKTINRKEEEEIRRTVQRRNLVSNSFLLLVAMPEPPSSVLAPSTARSP